MTMIFTIGGLAGQSLAPIRCLGDDADLDDRAGVDAVGHADLGASCSGSGGGSGSVLGAAGGAVGAAVGAWGLYTGSFVLFLAGSLLTGIYMSAQGFMRFAATDTASDAFRPKAISYVMAGGLISASSGRSSSRPRRMRWWCRSLGPTSP